MVVAIMDYDATVTNKWRMLVIGAALDHLPIKKYTPNTHAGERFLNLQSMSFPKVDSKHTPWGVLSKPVPKGMHSLGVVTGLCMCCPKREPKLLRHYHQHLLTCNEKNTKCLY